MNAQQYDQINGLNALGGCLWMVCLIGIIPVVTVMIGFKAALVIGGAAMLAVVWGISKAKANV
jgi:hypothetical protein